MFILFLCLAFIANSEIRVQAESTTSNDIHVKNTSFPVTGPKYEIRTEKHLNQNNSEVTLSFNENTTALIKDLKATVEKLIAHLEKAKSKPKESPRRVLHSSIYDFFPKLPRKKRTIENTTDAGTNSNMIPVVVQMDQAKDVENVTEAKIEKVNKTEEVENDSYYDWLHNDPNNATEVSNSTEASGRRSFNSDMEIAKVVRTRLLSYVHEHISDTMNKIDSLKNVKNSYGTNNIFNIGYIMANVDLIEKNLKKLREGINENNKEWAEAHILDVFDKVKYTNNVMTSLMTALKSIFNASPSNGVFENAQSIYG
ncbi:uncharacterized protein PF3D7_1120600-like [Cydia pomonella]|uniref:uncharacterized protein PF3D7_1120600-like n=1 Tax=Cydia pomonella TaxID=82600 RepID=UPI002ADDB185|nr:uncharacterized protein PF3D7_1120600-like [Cydia pomonella]